MSANLVSVITSLAAMQARTTLMHMLLCKLVIQTMTLVLQIRMQTARPRKKYSHASIGVMLLILVAMAMPAHG